jgi:hypothetical protein
MGRVLAILVMLVLASISPARAAVEVTEGADIGLDVHRVALVIGNGAYENVPSLGNTINDARAMAASLNRVGFKVFRAENVGRRDMQGAIEAFLEAVTPGSEALIYYAGHGVELDGQNYLLPTDVANLTPGQTYSLTADAVSLSLLLETLEQRRARVNIVVLDACRNNPFKSDGTRSLGGTRGLARLDPPQGTVVIYAASAGETALDNLGAGDTSGNGLFTRSLLKLIDQPGLELRSMVQELKEQVYEAAVVGAQRGQLPSYYDGLLGKFYFVPPGSAVVADVPDVPKPVSNRCALLLGGDMPADRLLFEDVSGTLEACREAAADGGADAAKLLGRAEERMAAQKALLSDGKVLGEAYLRLYPQGAYAADVRTHVASIGGVVVAPTPVTPVPDAAPATPTLPDAEVTPEIAALDWIRMVQGVQTELNRLGCVAGDADGNWGPQSRAALTLFADAEGMTGVGTEPSPKLLAQLRGVGARVCPPCFTFNEKQYCE